MTRRFEQVKLKKELLARHAKIFGYVKIPEEKMKHLQRQMMQKQHDVFHQRLYEIDR